MVDKQDELPLEPLPEQLPPELAATPGVSAMPMMGATDEIFYRSEMLRATEKLVKDDLIEEKLKDFELWPIISKTIKLTFVNEREANILRQLLEAEICRLMRSKPISELDGKFFENVGNARIVALLNINRSKGVINKNLLNERTALISQYKQIVTASQYQGTEKRGFWSKIFGR